MAKLIINSSAVLYIKWERYPTTNLSIFSAETIDKYKIENTASETLPGIPNSLHYSNYYVSSFKTKLYPTLRMDVTS